MKASITILIQELPDGRMRVDEFIAGELSLEVAANACRMIADKLDRERIKAEVEAEEQELDMQRMRVEVEAEQEGEDANRD